LRKPAEKGEGTNARNPGGIYRIPLTIRGSRALAGKMGGIGKKEQGA